MLEERGRSPKSFETRLAIKCGLKMLSIIVQSFDIYCA